MKLIPDLIHRNIAGEHLLIPAGETAHTYNGLFVMNPVAQRIRKQPEEGKNTDALIPLLLEEYEAERHLLLAGVVEFQDTPKNNGLLI
jgi:hypothetical protein